MDYVIELRQVLHDGVVWLWSHSRKLAVIGGICLIVACQENVDNTPIVVTEVIEFEGEELVITRVLTPTPPPTRVAANSDSTPPPSVVELDVSVFDDYAPFDPQLITDQPTLDLIENLYGGLTNHNPRTNAIESELALNWNVSQDGLTWTFNLRDDVYWVRPRQLSASIFSEDAQFEPVGVDRVRPVTANDVVFAVRRACDPATRMPDVFLLFIIEGCQAVNSLQEATSADLERIGVRALSDTEVSFSLVEPASYFLTMTSMPMMYPLPAEWVQDEELDWLDPEIFVSNGPFVLLNMSEAQKTLVLGEKPVGEPLDLNILQRNPHWSLPVEGNVELVNLYRYETRSEAFDVWQEQFLDITPLPAQQADAFLDPLNPRVLLALRQEAFYLGFNFDSPVFAVPEVRRAFSAAIDRDRLITEVYGREGLAMSHFAPPGVLYTPPIDEVGVGYSPSYAQFQLVESGFGACQLLGEIRYMIGTSDIALQHAETVRDMWVETLGCDPAQIVIEQVQFGTLLANTRRSAGQNRPDIYDLGWASFYPDAHNWYYDVLHCEIDNRPNRPCSATDDLIRQAGVAFSPDEREQLYRRVENDFFSDDGLFPIAPLYVRGDFLLTKPWIDQYTPVTFGGQPYDTIVIDQLIKDVERSQ